MSALTTIARRRSIRSIASSPILSVDLSFSSLSGQIKEDQQYCVDLVRERDREGYLCGLLMPPSETPAYFAIRALNAELASIKDSHHLRTRETPGQMQTSATMALKMRMQWWRVAIDEIYSSNEGRVAAKDGDATSVSCWHNPVVRALDRANQQCNFTRRFLERLVDAREADLEVTQPVSLQEACAYAEDTVGSLLYLSLECTGTQESAADEVASYAGVGIGLATSLRATPFRILHGEMPLPRDLLRPGFPYHELVRSPEELVLSDTDANLFQNAVRHMADTAAMELGKARDLQSQVPKHARVCLLPVVPSLHYLSKLESANYNLFDSKINDETRLRLLLLLGRTWLTGIF